MERPFFSTGQEYGRYFTNVAYWKPYLAAICHRHELGTCANVSAGFPGTNPVFIVDERYVVKLYTDLFDGDRSYPVEREVYQLIARTPAIPAPALVATGNLFDANGGWPWPYIVTSVIPGQSLSQSQVSSEDRLAIAAWLGPLLRHIHTLPLTSAGPLQPAWDAFASFLTTQKKEATMMHARWGLLPAHLVSQIDTYVPDLPILLDLSETPALLHCDLNSDHVLGEMVNGRWQPSGIIDFGDARAGDRIYDLIALHLGLFNCNKQLLHAFLSAYGFDEALQHDFVRRAMSMTLLFEFNVLSHIFDNIPAASEVTTLEDLAELVWGSALTL